MNHLKKLLLIAALTLPCQFSFGQAQIVINEIYGGGGNSGTFATFATVPALTMLAPGASYLISVGSIGGIGAALPTPNLTGSTGTNLAAGAGRVQMLNVSLAIVDMVGYGATALTFEGLGPAPGPSGNTTSINRTLGIDTNNNNLDFSIAAPSPTAMVPEPASYMLFGVGLLLCAQQFRRRLSNRR